LLALLLPLLLTAPAEAVIIDLPDGTGNTTAPADDPGFAHVGTKGALSVIYVGYGWVLSAAHVGLGDVVFGAVTYPALSGSRIVLIHSGATEADLELFRIDPAPPLSPLPIRASQPAINDPVIMIGNGRNRGAPVSVYPPPSVDDGYYWGSGRAVRWGTNLVDSIVPDVDTGLRVTDSFTTSFSRNEPPDDECQAANGDSGGAVFIKNAGTWELAGVMHATSVFAEQVGDLAETSLYGNLTYSGDLSQYRSAILDIITPLCGNGYLTIDEDCDDGNTEPGDCCSPTCQYESTATECRAEAGECDVAELCDGAGVCPADGFEPPGTSCGDPGSTTCDNPDSCDAAGTCLVNYEPATTVCRADAGVCDVADNCDGAGACDADAKLTTECRAGSICDVAESCNGVGNDCPADVFEPATKECRGAAGVCDAADNCDGAGACDADAKLTSECRAGSVCDVAESCNGVGNDCPPDVFEPATKECRADAGECDVVETCTGTGAACPADLFEPPETSCGDPGDTLCDNPDGCDAVGTCLANYEPATTECRGAAGVCDAVDNCDGAGACDADAKLTTVCRASTYNCDADEVCDGVTDDCLRDLPANGQPCPDGDLCNGDEICIGWTCTAGLPPDCDDQDVCTTDSCDPLQGCVHEPIAGGGSPCGRPDLPSASPAGLLLLSLLVVGAGATFLARRRFGA
jgi:hypothetical protein